MWHLLIRLGYLAVPPAKVYQFQFMFLGLGNSIIFGLPHPWLIVGTFFVAGSVAYLYREWVQPSPWLLALSIGLLLIGALPAVQGLSVVSPICLAYLFLALAFARHLPLPQVGRYGDFSYGVYLYAFPVQQLLLQFCHRWMTPIPLFCIASVLTFGLAFLSWHLVEKWFLKSRTRHTPAAALPQTELVAP